MEWDPMTVEEPDTGDRLVEAAAARAGQAVAVMKMLGAVNAHPKIDFGLEKKRTPTVVDQGSIRLKRMHDRHALGPQPIDQVEGIPVEIDRQDHRFPGVPDDGKAVCGPARCEDLGKQVIQRLL